MPAINSLNFRIFFSRYSVLTKFRELKILIQNVELLLSVAVEPLSTSTSIAWNSVVSENRFF